MGVFFVAVVVFLLFFFNIPSTQKKKHRLQIYTAGFLFLISGRCICCPFNKNESRCIVVVAVTLVEIRAVYNEGCAETVKMATILGIVYVVLEEHLKKDRERERAKLKTDSLILEIC